ncbi:hypothetical protein [Roseixanthobacter liquoris]|uniref:hypothetical protein n=1 Tax=Roseixanthobacter liquoris TaxID=3119921 RepID=UPI00372AD83C
MPKSVQIFALAFALVGGLALASPLYAEYAPSGPTKGSDMMGGGDMKGMMNMMTRMNQMMETCNKMMMQSSMGSDHGSYPNE